MTIQDISDLIQDRINDKLNDSHSKPFKKEQQVPPPQYHLECSSDKVKHRVTSYNLKSQFSGRKIYDFALLSKFGTGISVINEGSDLLTVGELVN